MKNIRNQKNSFKPPTSLMILKYYGIIMLILLLILSIITYIWVTINYTIINNVSYSFTMTHKRQISLLRITYFTRLLTLLKPLNNNPLIKI